MPETPAGVVFEAVIVPHRSLSRRGAVWLVGAVCGASAAISTGLWWLGAWPVIGFNGTEVALALVLLRFNNRARRTSERVLLSPDALRLERIDAQGRVRGVSFTPYWVRTLMEDRPGRTPVLWLMERTRRYEIAAALNEAEKRDLAQALGAALNRLQRPTFDNVQLRPPAEGAG